VRRDAAGVERDTEEEKRAKEKAKRD